MTGVCVRSQPPDPPLQPHGIVDVVSHVVLDLDDDHNDHP